MSERAAIYTVSVRPRAGRAGPLPLGDIDGAGTGLLDALATILGEFSQTSKDGSRLVRSLTVQAEGDDLFAIVQHGQTGIAADIVDPAGNVRLRQRPDDAQLVRCGFLFRLAPAATVGELAVHVSNGRGVKGLVEAALTARFRAAYPGLALELERLGEPDALGRALGADGLVRVRLVKVEQAGAHVLPGTGNWAPPGDEARIELEIAAGAGGARLDGSLLQRYLGGDASVLKQIVEFGGLTFDEAFVDVLLPDGSRRFFDLAHPEAGRPAIRQLAALVLDGDGEPTAESLLAALRGSLVATAGAAAGSLR